MGTFRPYLKTKKKASRLNRWLNDFGPLVGCSIYVGILLAYLAFWLFVGYAILHFIFKFW
jgi:hypothetical protein